VTTGFEEFFVVLDEAKGESIFTGVIFHDRAYKFSDFSPGLTFKVFQVIWGVSDVAQLMRPQQEAVRKPAKPIALFQARFAPDCARDEDISEGWRRADFVEKLRGSATRVSSVAY
jgi:hypothetical protein